MSLQERVKNLTFIDSDAEGLARSQTQRYILDGREIVFSNWASEFDISLYSHQIAEEPLT